MAIHLGFSLRTVSVRPDDQAPGHTGFCLIEKTPAWLSLTPNADWRSRSWAERKIVVCLAGGHAETRVTGEPADSVCRGDRKMARKLAGRLCLTVEERLAYLTYLSVRSRNIVLEEWTGIEEVAAVLMRKGRLSGAEALLVYAGV